jgi:hypothetical protein
VPDDTSQGIVVSVTPSESKSFTGATSSQLDSKSQVCNIFYFGKSVIPQTFLCSLLMRHELYYFLHPFQSFSSSLLRLCKNQL